LEECRSLEKLGGKERKLRVEVKGNKENRKRKEMKREDILLELKIENIENTDSRV